MSKRIPVKDLVLGDFVESLEGVFWQDTDPKDFPLQSLLVRSDADLDKIYKYGCRYVHVRDAQYKTVGAASPTTPTAFLKRLAEARQTYQSVRTLAMPLHRTVRAGRALNVSGIHAGLGRLIPKIARHEDALMWLTNLDKKDDQVVRHSVNVCLLSLIFGKHLGLADSALQELAVGALIHDIGKVKVSRRLLNQTEALTGRDREEMNRHVDFGVELAGRTGTFSDTVMQIMRLHHEHFDGGGFPNGITLDKPEHRPAQIVAFADAYDKMVRQRGGVTADRAIEVMRAQRGTRFHPTLLDAFVECVGDMPVGNLLELSNGEIGIELSKGSGVFLVFFDAQKRRLPSPKIVGLKFQGRMQPGFRIRQMLRPDAYGLDFNDCIDRAANF